MQTGRKKFDDMSSDPYLDEIDSAILRSLQADARTTLARVGRLVGLSPSSVHERIRRLQRDGVIRGWTLELDPRAVGRPVTAFVGVDADVTGGILAARLRQRQEVDECHSIAGDLSFFLKVRAADTEALLGLVDWIKELPGVRATRTTVVLKIEFERQLWLGPAPATEPSAEEAAVS
ncbi:MAG TPA: Lrp/AsnC family transcriptional regulator [Candidatus Dormibacteraeota bacterium]|nr:Lrp/AsnC family transcriptional regulator [Candidatus Dormibacteraeota bacterium]